MAGIIKCPKCGKNMLISKKVIETGKHKGDILFLVLSVDIRRILNIDSYGTFTATSRIGIVPAG